MPKSKRNEESAEGAAAIVKEKKKRTINPGVRVQGGRIYDSESGTTCHQCRQKTVEVKAKCTKCTLYWCPRCLLNRYGEAVEEVTQLGEWPCPRCRDQCNCSNCRKRRGLEATGILANVCKAAGIGSVSELLDKNPTAKRPTLPQAEPKSKVRKAPKEDKRPAAEAAASCQIPDGELDARKVPFPEGAPLRIFKATGKRVRGVVWPVDLRGPLAIPDDCSAGDLVEVTEFLHVFGKEAGCEVADLSLFAAELMQPAACSTAFCEDCNSPVGKVHQALLDLVRQDWGIKGSVGLPGWQQTMRQYLKQDLEEAAERLGKSMRRFKAAELPLKDGGMGVDGLISAAAIVEGGKETLPSYPQGGYWSLPPGARLRMLRALCHDALATQLLREMMEKAMGESAAAAKEQREEAAAARKEVRQAWQQERNRQIALLITGDGQGLTIEEQKTLMETAKTKVVAATAPELAEATVVDHPALRTLPLGEDRDGGLFWKLQTGTLFTGQTTCLLAAKPWRAVDADEWAWLEEPKEIALSLDSRGQMEGRLKAQLLKAFSITLEAAEEEGEASPKENKQPARRVAAKNGAVKAIKPAKSQAKKRKL